ncbi:MAG: WXG100 family type VII secretion target [Chloroflexi bacterium]|nr:WXG100 family type VII secretion target [Chloroflexota bacterium]
MARIKVSPEQVRQVAGQFKQASGQSQEMVNRLSQTVNSLQPDWEGMTKERFYGDFQQWSTSMRQFVELLNNIGTQLDAIAARFAAADQQ